MVVWNVLDDYDLKRWFKFEEYYLDEIKIYRVSFKRIKKPLFLPLNAISYFIASILCFYRINKSFGKADLHHVHVLTRAGVLPFFLKIFYGVPYVISEHWSRYLPERNSYKGFFRKLITKLIVNNSNGLATVSNNLLTAMNVHGLKHENSRIISNVVNYSWFGRLTHDNLNPFRFLHVSGLQDQIKNISGILRVVQRLRNDGFTLQLDIVGDGVDKGVLENLSKNLKLGSVVNFHGKLYGNQLIDKYLNSDAFVLFSNFENQPCVLLESFAVGLPVIATRVGGIPEIVNSKNGILVNPKNEDELYLAMSQILLHQHQFNKKEIRVESYLKYNQNSVAQSMIEFYGL